ncbi:hypothetical protein, conserved [Eimeria maxima]|uniref:Protein PBN1 n=1 Tax=Eimeria maxima TaxID=5804 RepID=U6M8U7_EIMMA|nr:hypothetical protein, conserved [Eimeria maxima]CDJ60456.1 hypothetical protein, conserved [Eimeria maxima]
MARHIQLPLLLLLLLVQQTPVSIYGSSSHAVSSSSSSGVSLSLAGASTTLLGKGFHLVFESRVLLKQQQSTAAAAAAAAAGKEEACLLWLEYRLPQQLFADPDQTYELGASDTHGRVLTGAPGGPLLLQPSTLFMPSCSHGGPQGAPNCTHGSVLVDVEQPSYSSKLGPPPLVRQEVYVHPSLLQEDSSSSSSSTTREVKVQLPVHLRYGPPCSSSNSSCNGLLRMTAAAPVVGLSCGGQEQQQQQLKATAEATEAAAAGEEAAAAAAAGSVEFSVPVGQRVHWAATSGVCAATLILNILAVVFVLAA